MAASVFHFLDHKLLSLSGGVLLELAAGSPYAFSVYSQQLKDGLNFTQSDIQAVASLDNVGLYFGLIPGLACDAFGPTISMLVGALLCGLGYSVMWAGATQRIAHTPGAMSVYALLWSHGSAWLDITAFTTTMRNFPHNKGLVVGLLKGFFGLSASTLTLVYTSWFKPDVYSYLLFCAIAIPAIGFAGGTLCRLSSLEEAYKAASWQQLRKLNAGYCVLLITAAYFAIVGVLQAQEIISDAPLYGFFLVPLVVFHLSYAFPWSCLRQKGFVQLSDDTAEPEHPHAEVLAVSEEEDTPLKLQKPPKVLSGASFAEALLSVDYLLVIVVLMIGQGCGLLMINNVGNLVASLQGSQGQQTVYVTLLSVCNCVGRMAFGFASDKYANRLSRPGWMTVCVALMGIGCLISAFAELSLLYFAVLVVGFAYGGFFSVGPALAMERFGARAYASIISSTALGTALSSYLLSAIMAPRLYQSHIETVGENNCYGLQCYQDSFFILSSLCVVGSAFGLLLTRRVRELYSGVGGHAIDYREYAEDSKHNAIVLALRRHVYPRCCVCGRQLIAFDDPLEEKDARMVLLSSE